MDALKGCQQIMNRLHVYLAIGWGKDGYITGEGCAIHIDNHLSDIISKVVYLSRGIITCLLQ